MAQGMEGEKKIKQTINRNDGNCVIIVRGLAICFCSSVQYVWVIGQGKNMAIITHAGLQYKHL